MRVLGIETSCDDTGIAVYDTEHGIIAEETHSQLTHQKFGGVVPELASRDHIKKVIPMIDNILKRAQISPTSLDAIAYTKGPGLAGALMVGTTIAQGLSMAWQCPTIGVHHLEGHLLAPMLDNNNKPTYPFLALLISGGHTQIILVHQLGNYTIIGESLDDAVGEAFDKTAKLLGLPYPGGPHLENLALLGDPNHYQFPRPLWNRADCDFSFSGLKTHVAQLIASKTLTQQDKANIAAQFEITIADILTHKIKRAIMQHNVNQLVVAGGVAANKTLRDALTQQANALNVSIYFPAMQYCTDNGAMIAYAGAMRLRQGHLGENKIAVKPRWPLSELNA